MRATLSGVGVGALGVVAVVAAAVMAAAVVAAAVVAAAVGLVGGLGGGVLGGSAAADCALAIPSEFSTRRAPKPRENRIFSRLVRPRNRLRVAVSLRTLNVGS
jgi:hypothetical protein